MALLDPEIERIQDDLRGLISGEVRLDDVIRQLFATDGSIHEIRPLGVVCPRSTADVVACVEYTAEKGIPLHARGAGTGISGESLGRGLVIDFSRHLRRILQTEADWIRVQPGVVQERLNAHLRPNGRLFGPDPALSSVTTIGSLLAINGAGSHWLKYGSTHEHVLGLQVVLADGEVLEFGRERLPSSGHHEPNARKRKLIERLTDLLTRNDQLIRTHRPNGPIGPCGYNLSGVLCDDFLDMPKLLAGSEGTLALFTEIRLSTQPIPQHQSATLLLFDSLDNACRAVPTVLESRPTVCDMMDRRHLSLVRETEVRFDVLVPAEAEAVLLVEHDADDPFELRDRIHTMVDDVQMQKGLAFGNRQAFDPIYIKFFCSLVQKIHPAFYRMRGSSRPTPVVEDLAIPPERLPDFMVELQNLLKRHEVVATLFSHAGQGQLHVQPFLDLGNPAEIRHFERLTADLYEAAVDVGGVIGGEFGCGLSRTLTLRRHNGPLNDVFREVKRIFDPENRLNPGKIVQAEPDQSVLYTTPPGVFTIAKPATINADLDDDLATMETQDIRPAVPVETTSETPEDQDEPILRDILELQLNWNPAEVSDVARACNGCGECRSQTPETRMCPMFRILPIEEATPRSKANLIRGVLTERLELSSLTGEEFKAIADLCIRCYMCVEECKTQVDIPRAMLVGKGAHMKAQGMSFSDRMLVQLEWIEQIGSRISPIANWALGNRMMRWVLEKTLGIAQGRKLPRFTSKPFLGRAAKRRLIQPNTTADQKVAYFVDSYANFHDPKLAEAAVAVLKHNGVSVYVPPEQQAAGMSAMASGAVDQARRLAQHNVSLFADAVRQGYHIVATEPAAAVCLTREYPCLIDDEDARLVADNTSELCTYLRRMHTSGKLRLDFQPVHFNLVYHTPCRLKALRVGTPGKNLLNLIPGLIVHHCEETCSGMAGTFGLKRANYRASLRIGFPLISRVRDHHIQAGTTECSACKMQMEQGTTKVTIHPIKILAHAYGLMPQVAQQLTTPSEELIIR